MYHGAAAGCADRIWCKYHAQLGMRMAGTIFQACFRAVLWFMTARSRILLYSDCVCGMISTPYRRCDVRGTFPGAVACVSDWYGNAAGVK